MSLQAPTRYDGSRPDDVARGTAIGDRQKAPDALPMAIEVAKAEQRSSEDAEVEAENDPLADIFLQVFPIALLVVAIFAAVIAGSP